MKELIKELHEVVADTWKAYRIASDNSNTEEEFFTNILIETDPLDEKFRNNKYQKMFYTKYIRLLADITHEYYKEHNNVFFNKR